MSLENLLEAVRTDAEERRLELLERARAQADRIVEEARERARARREEHRRRLEEEARASAAARTADARRQARERILAARTRALEQIFHEARTRFPGALSREEYRDALPALLSAALAPLQGAEAVVRCAPELAGPLRQILEAEMDGRETEVGAPSVAEDPAVSTGLVVADPEAGLEVDVTLGAGLRRLRPRLSIELVERVEGPSRGTP